MNATTLRLLRRIDEARAGERTRLRQQIDNARALLDGLAATVDGGWPASESAQAVADAAARIATTAGRFDSLGSAGSWKGDGESPAQQKVEGCTTCPYSSDGTSTDADGNGDWHCHGEYTPEGWPRVLPAASDRPPQWCPLRTAPRLIVLEVPR